MKRLLLGSGVLAVLAIAVVLSKYQPATADRTTAPTAADDLKIATEAKNPWTNLKLNDAPDQFQFAVVSDRTGGHRPKIFSRAVQQINLLQPSFVMSVGDLIEGYTQDADRVTTEWDEFDSFTKQFRMPFFYVPGNHDMTNNMMLEKWKERYGKRNYHFVYKDTLFLTVNCEDPPGTLAVSEGQRKEIEKALTDNAGVRWTFVFVHKPIWQAADLKTNGWLDVEKALAGRKYTVFCGHLHRYQKYVRNGMNYYQLATTGGGSRMRGVEYGEFDQVAWVTMKNGGPVVANVILDGVLPEDLAPIPSDEEGYRRKAKAGETVRPVTATVTRNGKPASGATVAFYQAEPLAPGKPRFKFVADGLTMADGTAKMTTYGSFDGVPVGEYSVSLIHTGGYRVPGDLDELNKFPKRYAGATTTPLKVTVAADGDNDFSFDVQE